MIDEIQVENLALIREATLVPARGLTVLTGETGAGKTALLSALKLLMGARADKDAVRDGEDSLTVSGRFYGIASADGSESDAALAAGDFDELRELVATRRVTADGRSRVSIDGRMASVGELARAVASTIDLCGQHEHQQLMKTSQHVRMLDAWAGEAVAQAHAAYEEALATANAAAAELARVREAGYVLEDMARETRDYREGVEFDPEALAQQQERMASLQGLLRMYGPRMEDVLARRAEAADLVSLVDDAAERERAAQQELDRAEEALAQAAAVLTEARAEAAPRFAAAVCAQMDRLEMGGAELVCDLAPLERGQWTKVGPQAVEFLFRPGAGMQARPLARIASGGEVSRVMLAVKVVLGEADEVDTLVFDEVDAGVGGSTAVALADVLADLARTHQVIVVTHLAQVAVRGQAHYVVQKAAGDEGAMPETDLRQLDSAERPAEIARMLSGDATETSLAHARELLERAAD